MPRRAVLLVLVLGGCAFPAFSFDLFDSTGSGAASSGWSACSTWAPGSGAGFRYVCPTNGADGGALSGGDAGPFSIGEGSDPACVMAAGVGSSLRPVAVGEPFRLEYADYAQLLVDAAAPIVEPAVPRLAQVTPQGWTLPEAGYLGFIAWQGAQAVDFTHIQARTVVGLGLVADSIGSIVASPWQDAQVKTVAGVAGVPMKVAAFPVSDDGTALAGAVACTFVSSDSALLAVDAAGIVAEVTPLAAGNATLTATCGAFQAAATFVITGILDAGSGEAPDPDVPSPDAPDAGVAADAGDADAWDADAWDADAWDGDVRDAGEGQ